MNEKTPWYKRFLIWLAFAGAMVVGAFLLFGKWVRWNLFRTPMKPQPNDREIMDQKIEDELKIIEKEIEEMKHEQPEIYVPHGKTIVGINVDMAKARELRRARRELESRRGDRGANRRSDDDTQGY